MVAGRDYLAAQGKAAHASENPEVLFLFMQCAQQLGTMHQLSLTDLATAEEDFSGDAEVSSQLKDFKAKLEEMGLPTAIPKPPEPAGDGAPAAAAAPKVSEEMD
eukprot:TRINITY_DN18451_c0_g1_i2.p3 TRINITY_DN18451_c0_g1~~TRINITY_DN18451_c0_g1_i2.p3  ORF type:complete len:104 (+),score=47.38 TRINITY_DN18451_c0_g1_i2:86-397(+)